MPYRSDLVGNAFVVEWERPELSDLARLRQDVRNHRKRLGGPLHYFAIVPANSEPPSDEVRKEMIDRMGEILESCESMHFVLEGTGFKHVVARSALSGILLVAGKRGRVFVHRTLGEALRKAGRSLSAYPTEIVRMLGRDGTSTGDEESEGSGS